MIYRMGNKPLKIYVDTSVFGGVFDKEFAESSKVFFHRARLGVFTLISSAAVRDEIGKAPEKVVTFFKEISTRVEILELEDEAVRLRQAYLQAGIVSEKYSTDALHVAIASVSGCSVIVSWNFKHIVNLKRIPLYNAVNVLNGYASLSIVSPLEVLYYEDEN